MKSFSNIIFLVCITVGSLFAQTKDSVKSVNKFLPTGIRAGVDVVSIARTQYVEGFEAFEVSVDVDVYRYFPTVEFGSGSRKYASSSGSTYESNGSFWRAGLDVNFMRKDADKGMFFLGARYGRSAYSEKSFIVASDSLWGNFQQSFTNTDMTANWLELTTGLRVKVWKFFWMGYTGRFKFGLKTDKTQPLLSTDVPGYGATDRPTTWGFSYYLMAKLPVRKQR